MKKFIPFIALFFACVQTPIFAAVEKVDQPFKYFLSTMGISEDTAYWGLTPTVAIPDLIISNDAKNDGGIQVNYFNSVGFGLDYGRYIKSAGGKIYETFGGSIFGSISGNENASLCGDVHFFNRLVGFGGAVNFGAIPKSQRFSFLIITSIKPF